MVRAPNVGRLKTNNALLGPLGGAMRRLKITLGLLLATAPMFVMVGMAAQAPAERSFEVDTLASNLHVLRNGRSGRLCLSHPKAPS